MQCMAKRDGTIELIAGPCLFLIPRFVDWGTWRLRSSYTQCFDWSSMKNDEWLLLKLDTSVTHSHPSISFKPFQPITASGTLVDFDMTIAQGT